MTPEEMEQGQTDDAKALYKLIKKATKFMGNAITLGDVEFVDKAETLKYKPEPKKRNKYNDYSSRGYPIPVKDWIIKAETKSWDECYKEYNGSYPNFAKGLMIYLFKR